jgi:hypothetical protein
MVDKVLVLALEKAVEDKHLGSMRVSMKPHPARWMFMEGKELFQKGRRVECRMSVMLLWGQLQKALQG